MARTDAHPVQCSSLTTRTRWLVAGAIASATVMAGMAAAWLRGASLTGTVSLQESVAAFIFTALPVLAAALAAYSAAWHLASLRRRT
jgi:hypothetical protein